MNEEQAQKVVHKIKEPSIPRPGAEISLETPFDSTKKPISHVLTQLKKSETRHPTTRIRRKSPKERRVTLGELATKHGLFKGETSKKREKPTPKKTTPKKTSPQKI